MRKVYYYVTNMSHYVTKMSQYVKSVSLCNKHEPVFNKLIIMLQHSICHYITNFKS